MKNIKTTSILLIISIAGLFLSLPLVTQASCTITRQDCTNNHTPVANAGPDQTVTQGETVQFDASGSYDADGDPLTYQWFINGTPTTLTGAKPTYSGLSLGVHVVTLVVDDGCGCTQDNTVILVKEKPQPSLKTDKLVSDNNETRVYSNTAQRGEELTYHLKLENNSVGEVINLVLTDNYEQNYVTVLSTDGGIDDGDKITWQIGNMSGYSSFEKRVRVRVKDTITSSLSFKNYLTCTANNAGPCIYEVTTQVEVPQTFPELQIEKTVSDNDETRVTYNTAQRNEILTYYLKVKNNAAGKMTDVKIEDNFDQTYVEPVSWETGGTNNGDKIIWEIGDLNGYGTVEKIMNVKVKDWLTNETTFKNYLRVYTANAGNQSREVTTRVAVPENKPSLYVDKKIQDSDESYRDFTTSQEDEILSYRLKYRIDGSGTARNVIMRDNYDERYLEILSTDGGSNNGSEIVWYLNDRQAGEDGYRYVTARIKNNITYEVEFSNWVYLSADNASSVEDSVRTRLNDTSDVYANIIKTVTDSNETNVHFNRADAGEEMTYKIKITNNSIQKATRIYLEDDYDQDKITLISFTGQATDDRDKITWFLGDLNPYQSVERYITVQIKNNVSNNTTFDNFARIRGANIKEDQDQTTTTVSSRSEVNITKTVTDDNEFDRHNNTAQPTEILIYTITVENTSQTTLENVVILDNYDERYLKIISVDGGLDDSHLIRWQLGNLAPGAQTTRIITAEINDQVKNGLNVINRVTVTANNTTPDNDSTITYIYIPGTKITATTTPPIAPRTGAGLLLPGFGGLSAGSMAGYASYIYLKRRKRTLRKKELVSAITRFDPGI